MPNVWTWKSFSDMHIYSPWHSRNPQPLPPSPPHFHHLQWHLIHDVDAIFPFNRHILMDVPILYPGDCNSYNNYCKWVVEWRYQPHWMRYRRIDDFGHSIAYQENMPTTPLQSGLPIWHWDVNPHTFICAPYLLLPPLPALPAPPRTGTEPPPNETEYRWTWCCAWGYITRIGSSISITTSSSFINSTSISICSSHRFESHCCYKVLCFFLWHKSYFPGCLISLQLTHWHTDTNIDVRQ